VGRISYGIYVYHLPVLSILEPRMEPLGLRDAAYGLPGLALYGTITLGVAAVSWKLLEGPANRLRHRLELQP
jgi:peptidoglycan/LPS O-acetylase OafA/YrhL